MWTVLIVDDDALIREIAKDILENASYRVLTAKDVPECLTMLRKEKIDAFLLDVVMPGESGLKMVPKINEESPDSAVIIMTGFASTDTAIEAIKVGADDFIRKPLQDMELLHALKKAIDKKALLLENAKMTEDIRISKETLQRAHDELEKRVIERTAELSASNKALKLEVIERKAAEEKTRHHLEQIAALRSIDKAIAGSFDLGKTLNIIVEQIISQLKVDAATILLYKPHLEILEYAAGHGFNTQALQYTSLAVGNSYAGQAALERRIVHISDLRKNGEGFKQSEHFNKEGFISYYGVPLIAKGFLKGVLEVFLRNVGEHHQEWVEFLEALAGQAAIAIDNATMFENLQSANINLTLSYDETIEGWSRALDLRDKETEGHSQRVTELTMKIVRILGVSEAEQAHIRRGALLHDIGKMGIPDSILLNPGALDAEEWEIMRQHTTFAYELLSPIDYLRPALDIPYCHHEKWDGTGYPRGLKEEQIPLAARIFSVADIYDAMCSERPYHPPWPEETVLEHIRSLAGSHLDPKLVKVFLTMDKAILI